MERDCVVIIDCGATKLTVVAVNTKGQFVKTASCRNKLIRQPGGKRDWYVWDLEEIWERLCSATRELCQGLTKYRIKGVLVMTFGSGGAPVTQEGVLTYPIISVHGTRGEEFVSTISESISPWDIYKITGYQIRPFYVSALFRLLWLRKYAPDALERAKIWLNMPGLLNLKLTGEFSLDTTSASTIMAMNLSSRDWSKEMLGLAKLDPSFFPPLIEPGEEIGCVTFKAHRESGLPKGIPVFAAGHDTQFAAIGSGARDNEIILSSGTWELLLIREKRFQPSQVRFEKGLYTELDAFPGLWDTQSLMIGSGVLEWVRRYFYGNVNSEKSYQIMICEGEKIDEGANGVTFIPSFVADAGPTRNVKTKGTILGLSLLTERADIYRAALEGLSFQLRNAITTVSLATQFAAKGIRVVGGGSRNDLWNQIRADVTGLPVTTICQKEGTILGAASIGFISLGFFNSIEEVQDAIDLGEKTFEPGKARVRYQELYQRYIQLPRLLEPFYA